MKEIVELKYKTRGNVSPIGKRKVFFLATSKDKEIYFESMSEEIFSNINAAIYYVENIQNIDLNEAEFKADFLMMDLYLIPITNELFNDQKVLNIIKILKDNKKLFLPIFKESNLVKKFTNVFGDIQYLDPISKNKTEIPYEIKLNNFLTSLIVNDELVDKIKSSFDAYIFMSYRKKDRESALKLMNLIHSNEFLRSIAIWYDEYLIPGTHFEDAIKKALVESDLFALVVTPSLLEKGNYIQSVEYKLAQEYHKNLIPFKLKETDENSLKEMYENIPNIEDIDLSNIESSIFKKIGSLINKTSNSKEHNFFIGLAYLYGIDVEKNIDLALNLLNLSADENLKEALFELAKIYKNGNGVTKELKTSYKYFLRYLKLVEEDFYNEQNKESLTQYLNTLISILDYEKLLKIDFIQLYKLKTLKIYKSNPEFKDLLDRFFADAKVKYSSSLKNGKFKRNVNRYYREAIKTYSDLYYKETNYENKLEFKYKELLITNDFIGYLLSNHSTWLALDYVQKPVEFLLENYKDLARNNHKYDLAYCLLFSKFALTLKYIKKYDYALKLIEIALPKARQYAYETSSLDGKKTYLEVVSTYLNIYSSFESTKSYILPAGFLVKDIQKLLKEEDYYYLYKEFSEAVYFDALSYYSRNQKNNSNNLDVLKALFNATKTSLSTDKLTVIASYYTLLKYKECFNYLHKFDEDEITKYANENIDLLEKVEDKNEIAFNLKVIKIINLFESGEVDYLSEHYVFKLVDKYTKKASTFKYNLREIEDNVFEMLFKAISYYLDNEKLNYSNYLLVLMSHLVNHDNQDYQVSLLKFKYQSLKNSNYFKNNIFKKLNSDSLLTSRLNGFYELNCMMSYYEYLILREPGLVKKEHLDRYEFLLRQYVNDLYSKDNNNSNYHYYLSVLKKYMPLLVSRYFYKKEDIINSKLYKNALICLNNCLIKLRESNIKVVPYIYELIKNANLISTIECSYFPTFNEGINYEKLEERNNIYEFLLSCSKDIKLTSKLSLEIAKSKIIKADVLYRTKKDMDISSKILMDAIDILTNIKSINMDEIYLSLTTAYLLLVDVSGTNKYILEAEQIFNKIKNKNFLFYDQINKLLEQKKNV